MSCRPRPRLVTDSPGRGLWLKGNFQAWLHCRANRAINLRLVSVCGCVVVPSAQSTIAIA